MTSANPMVPEINRARAGRSPVVLAAALTLAAALFCGLGPREAGAQSMEDQIQRLQRELSDLQRQVYGGEGAPAAAAPSSAATSGATSGGVAPTQAARIELRLNQFEAELRNLTGQVEEMRFQSDSVSNRLDRLVADVDLRLQQLEQGGQFPVAGTPGSAGASAAMPSDSSGFAQGGSAAAGSSSGSGSLGSISETDLQNFQRQQDAVEPAPAVTAGAGAAGAAPAAMAALPGTTPREQYDYAFGLLRQANYEGAEQALSTFLAQYPADPLAGNAKYWLGETYYVRGDYQQAAVTFAEGFEAYPNNPKAPDNLLKLGMSLASLGSKEDACGTFDVLQQRYADASATIIQRARQESQRIGC